MNDREVIAWFDSTLANVLTADLVDVDTQVAWPGMQFDSDSFPADKDWYQPKIMLGQPSAAELGPLGQNVVDGFYQVVLYGGTANNESEQVLRDRVYPIVEAFKRGTTFSGTNPAGQRYCIHCKSSWIFNSDRDTMTARWTVTVRVRFEAYMDN